MSDYKVSEADLVSVANAIRTKGGTSAPLSFPTGFNSAIDAIPTGIEPLNLTYSQENAVVKSYIDTVDYSDDPSYTRSDLATYLAISTDYNKQQPSGGALLLDGGILKVVQQDVTYEESVIQGNRAFYNITPEKADYYIIENNEFKQYGSITPTDRLRMIKCDEAGSGINSNIRDLGGWTCDGGTVKYGKIFRGSEINAAARECLVDQCGIKHELNLRGESEAHSSRTEDYYNKSYLGDNIGYTCPTYYPWYSLKDTGGDVESWKEIIKCIFNCAIYDMPLYFHCASGFDRTGTVACVIEAILGVSQWDCDKEFELSMNATRIRTGADWKGLMNQISALTRGSSFRDKVLYWIASLGFTEDEINAFRDSMIDGTPTHVSLGLETYEVTNALTNVASTNEQAEVSELHPYNAEITPNTGYTINGVTITMGGVDITSTVWKGHQTFFRRNITKALTNCILDNATIAVIDGQSYCTSITVSSGYTLTGGTINITMGGVDVSTFYSDGKIMIPNVTGDLVITISAVESRVDIPLDIQQGGFLHAVGDDVRTEDTNASYAKSQIIDVTGFSNLTISTTYNETTSNVIYIYFCGNDYLIDSVSEAWNLKGSVKTKDFVIPSGTNYIRLRGYDQLYTSRDTMSVFLI